MAPVLPADEERKYYDDVYRRFLDSPDEDLAFGPEIMAADLANPRKPVYERRVLFGLALDLLLAEDLKGATALEYGCGTGDWGLVMAARGASVTLLDLSPVAVEVGLRRAVASGFGERVKGVARDATDLACFGDAAFDVILAAFSLHHTLKHPGAMEELHRILKPGGKLILVETSGNNALLDAARVARRILSREPKEQGEGIVIGDEELRRLSAMFGSVSVRPVNLLAMAKRVFRGRFALGPVMALMRGLEAGDRFLLGQFPRLRRYCGEMLVVAVKSAGAVL